MGHFDLLQKKSVLLTCILSNPNLMVAVEIFLSAATKLKKYYIDLEIFSVVVR